MGDVFSLGKMGKTLLLDGFNLAFRSFYAIPELTRADGFPTNALHGWLRTLLKLEEQESPCRLEVFFDLGGDVRREALHPEYKAHRTEMPEALQQQMPWLKEIVRGMGMVLWELNGVEADDLMAGRARILADQQEEVWLVTADKDLAQCVGGAIRMLVPPPTANPKLGWRRWGVKEIQEKFGVPPERIAEYLALVGDAVDNIPGLAGVGPKTAANWLNEFGNLEGIIEGASFLKPPRFRELVPTQADRLRANLELTRLIPPDPLPPVPAASADKDGLLNLLENMEMRTLRRELATRFGEDPEADFRLE